MTIRYLATGLKQVRLEQLSNEIQMDDLVFDTELSAVMRRERDLPVIMFRSIMKANGGNDLVVLQGIVKCRN